MKNMKDLQRAAWRLLGQLRSLSAHDRMALQQAGLKGGSPTLPARPDLDGPGLLVDLLQSLEAAAAADLARLAELGKAYRWLDWTAGSAEGVRITLAHEAVPIWLHFRADRRPTSSTSVGSFGSFAAVLHEMATGDGGRNIKRDVENALAYYSTAIARRYGETQSLER